MLRRRFDGLAAEPRSPLGRGCDAVRDAPARVEVYRHFGLDKERVDLALAHFWFPFGFNLATFPRT